MDQILNSGFPVVDNIFPERSCFHCGLDVPATDEFTLTVQDQRKLFCCAGCQAVTAMIYQGGLEQFYQYRSALNQKVDAIHADFSLYDRESVQQGFVTVASRDGDEDRQHNVEKFHRKTAHLLLDGITCAACVWLIEKAIRAMAGVDRVMVNASTHQCTITWDSGRLPLSRLMQRLVAIGYRPRPFCRQQQQQQQQQQQRQLLLRLGVAGFGMMQVGMVAIALYAGAIQGIDAQWVQLFRWVSLLVATPVVFFSARPFWYGAWCSIKNLVTTRRGYLTMDVPVSLAIFLAWGASAWATISHSAGAGHSGEVYFDSISMFTFFLLLGRYLELRLRIRNQQAAGVTAQLLPLSVTRCSATDDSLEIIPLIELSAGDRVRVYSGDTIPCDGLVLDGHSQVAEALLTGESAPVQKTVDDRVIAGTLNTGSSLLIEVEATGGRTRLSTISRLVDSAEQDKPRWQRLADVVAGYFIAAVLVVALGVFVSWWQIAPESALWIALSVLVVTCPCALSLATPVALTATVSAMRRCGLLVLKGHVIETLPMIDKIIFDKTGTLTRGEPVVTGVECLDGNLDRDQLLSIAAALEEGSSHPLARAFSLYSGRCHATGLATVTGSGVTGIIDGSVYRLGKAGFALTEGNTGGHDTEANGRLLLTKNARPVAWITVSDQLRESAREAVAQLQQQGIAVEILSGDHPSAVRPLAESLNVNYRARQTPEQKLEYIREQQRQHCILMVGDGINDVPVLAGADVSIAMDTATDFARTRADSVLLRDNLMILPRAIGLARFCKKIIRQNLCWALGYNLLALPLAAMGFIPPWLAAIGMSASSLAVVANALRLHRRHDL